MQVTRFRALALVALSFAVSAASAAPRTGSLEVDSALARAKLPAEAMVALVQEVGATRPRLAWQPDQPVNPASVTKLVTTYAALDLLGPAFTWTTPVWLQGTVANGVLQGDLVIKGTGDPKLVLERIWLLLRRVQQQGVREIRGDIVLDRSGFIVPEQSPADFDGEPLRPYNVRSDALLLNYRSVLLTFTPDPTRGTAQVSADPPLDGVAIDSALPLAGGPCEDWRGGLKAEFADPSRIRFAGPLSGGLRREGLADSVRRAGQLQPARPRWHVARDGRAAQRQSPRRRRTVVAAELRDRLADLARGHPRHQQVQQQRDGAAAVPDARPAPTVASARPTRRAPRSASGCSAAWEPRAPAR